MSHKLHVIEKNTGSDRQKQRVIPIALVSEKNYPEWLKKQSPYARSWLSATDFSAKSGEYALIPAASGGITQAVCIVEETTGIWSAAHLPGNLPPGNYAFENKLNAIQATNLCLGWALATYQFTKYKKSKKNFATLIAPQQADMNYVRNMSECIFWARDMINTPACDMNPQTLAEEAISWSRSAKGKAHLIKGEDLLTENYPMIYAVGKAAAFPPHLVDIIFSRKGAAKVTLVGKGVCFDSGGLDIKSTGNMKLMKKDMGGAANVLALAKSIINSKIPVELRVILPIVENAISGNAMRPLDIVKTRKGLSVEIGNTDAEGRLILCDALTEADSAKPDLLIDFATLTGAARVALGAEIPAFFTNDETLAAELTKASETTNDPLWRLPLWKNYRSMLDTANADLSNDPDSSYGGAITAALYLNEFVSKDTSWLHIDMMAWNLKGRPGRPAGGEAMCVRALYNLVRERYGS